jgi:hypothetical protein
MATETRTAPVVSNPYERVQHGVAGGLVAGLAMGAMLQFVLGVMPAVGALYTLGEPSLTVGWVAHLVHSVLFGAVFAVIGGPALLGDYLDGYAAGVVSGAAFGTALWAVNVVVIWPLWLSAVSLSGGPGFPYLAVQPLVGHLVYGVLLGVVVTVLAR